MARRQSGVGPRRMRISVNSEIREKDGQERGSGCRLGVANDKMESGGRTGARSPAFRLIRVKVRMVTGG